MTMSMCQKYNIQDKACIQTYLSQPYVKYFQFILIQNNEKYISVKIR